MSTSVGHNFPTSNINPGHTHYDESVSPARAFMYKGGDPADLVNSWTEVDLAATPDIFMKSNANGNIPTSQVEVDAIGGIITQDIISSHVLSSGLITGGTVTGVGNNTVNVASGKVLLRVSNDPLAQLYYVQFSAITGLSVPSDTTRYIFINYNSGVPNITAETSYSDDDRTCAYLAEAHNIGGSITIHNDPVLRGDYTFRLNRYIEELIGNRVASGESVSEAGTRNLIVTAGAIWDRHINEILTSSFDSSGAGVFTTIYRSATPGEFTLTTDQAQWNNTQYDDNSGTLATLTVNTYGVHFVIRGLDGSVALMYGQAEYSTQALAEAASAPTLKPEQYDEHGIFISRIVFLKSAATLTTVMDIRPVIGGTSGSGASASISLPLAVAQGGTGAITAAGARTNLGLSSVTDDAQLKRAAGDFNTFSEKTKIVSSDIFLIEDGEDSLNKKKVFGNNLMWADQQAITFSTNFTVSWALANTQYVTLANNTTINFDPMVNGQTYRLILIQDAGGSRLVTWGATIKWPAGAVPTLTTDINKADIVTILYINSVIYADARLNF